MASSIMPAVVSGHSITCWKTATHHPLSDCRLQPSLAERGEKRSKNPSFLPFCHATFSLLLSFFLPTDGLGVTICWFKLYYELPCPGCGLTRSITCISQFQFSKAWNYHPFGPAIYVLLSANIVLFLIPRSKRIEIRKSLLKNDYWLRPIYIGIVISFLVFGCVRILVHAY